MGIKTSLASKDAKNLIINPSLDFWGRGNNFVGNSNLYAADRFQFQISGSGRFDIQRITDVPTASKSTYSWIQTCDVTNPSTAATDYSLISHKIEGQFFKAVKGRKLFCSFWVKSNQVGTFTMGFRNGDATKAFVKEYTINAINTWEKKIIQFTHDDTGNWFYDDQIGLEVIFMTSAGSNYFGVDNTWGDGSNISTSNQVDLLSTLGNSFQFTELCLYEGVEEIPFENLARNYQEEQLLCQRYFHTDQVRVDGFVNSSGFERFQFPIPLPVEMRVMPVVSTIIQDAGNIRSPIASYAFVFALSSAGGSSKRVLGAQIESTSGIPNNQFFARMAYLADAEL